MVGLGSFQVSESADIFARRANAISGLELAFILESLEICNHALDSNVADPCSHARNLCDAAPLHEHNVCPSVTDKDGDRNYLANCNPNDPRPDRWLAHQW